jgi:hypothetical protein
MWIRPAWTGSTRSQLDELAGGGVRIGNRAFGDVFHCWNQAAKISVICLEVSRPLPSLSRILFRNQTRRCVGSHWRTHMLALIPKRPVPAGLESSSDHSRRFTLAGSSFHGGCGGRATSQLFRYAEQVFGLQLLTASRHTQDAPGLVI